MQLWTSRGRPSAVKPNCINKIITAGLVRSVCQERVLIMARPAPGTLRVCVLLSGALGLGSCQNLHNSLDSLAGGTPMQELSVTSVSPPPMVLISHAMNEDNSRVTT